MDSARQEKEIYDVAHRRDDVATPSKAKRFAAKPREGRAGTEPPETPNHSCPPNISPALETTRREMEGLEEHLPQGAGGHRSMSAARTLRLQKVRESSISPTALLDRKLRATYTLTGVAKPHGRQRMVERGARRGANGGASPVVTSNAVAAMETAAQASTSGVQSPGGPGATDANGGAAGAELTQRFVRPGARGWNEHKLFQEVRRGNCVARVLLAACVRVASVRPGD